MQDIEHLDGLFGSSLVAMYWHRGINNLLHTTTDSPNIVESDGASDRKVYIVTVTNRYVDSHLALGKELVNCLTEHKEKTTGISTRTTRRSNVKELNLLLLIWIIPATRYPRPF